MSNCAFIKQSKDKEREIIFKHSSIVGQILKQLGDFSTHLIFNKNYSNEMRFSKLSINHGESLSNITKIYVWLTVDSRSFEIERA